MSAEQTPDIAAVLEAHVQIKDISGVVLCMCGNWVAHMAGGSPGDNERHRAHVAAALAPVLAAAVREAEQRALRSVDPLAKLDALHAHVGLGDEWQSSPRRAEVAALQAADRITEPVSHEAATSGEEASKA